MILRSLCFGGDFALIVFLFIFCGSLFLRRWFCEKGPKIEFTFKMTAIENYYDINSNLRDGFLDHVSETTDRCRLRLNASHIRQSKRRQSREAPPHRTAPASPGQSGFQFGRVHKSHAAAKILTEAADVKFGGCFN